jgi:thiamine-monophosphate kinase
LTTERQFIQQLQQRFPARSPVQVGIGDDGAVLNCQAGQQQVVVTDMLLDQVHFDLQTTSAALVGRKAVAVNLSDLAAMACWPTAAFISIAIPRVMAAPDQFLSQLYDAMAELADQYRFTIAGGDTNRWDGPFAINVCLTGVPMGQQAILRSGAKPGDKLFVTGPLGGSLASHRHLTFEPKLQTAMWLVENATVNAMMDISDGLSIDLHRMMEASGTGGLLSEDGIPIHDDVPESLSRAVRLQAALSDGEDFELLFALSDDTVLQSTAIDFHLIGYVTDQVGKVVVEDSCGDRSVLPESGWQHS